ncbi:MAG: alpha/beta fold hydrolase [Planctomycetota bacterium]|nr:MAG: alpha/beta fold hydrolase [Planctomycetota bacterium]
MLYQLYSARQRRSLAVLHRLAASGYNGSTPIRAPIIFPPRPFLRYLPLLIKGPAVYQQVFFRFFILFLSITAAGFTTLSSPLPAADQTSPVDRSRPQQVLEGVELELPDGASAAGGTLFIPDVKARRLWRFQPSNAQNRWRALGEGEGAFSATFYQLGTLYVADSAGSRILRLEGNRLVPWVEFSDGARPNDLVVDIYGNALVTITREGEVRRVAADGTIATVASGLETPNGIALSPDGQTVYVSLYKPGVIVQANVNNERIGPFTELARLEPTERGALADGMTIDRAGNVYCCGAAAVWIFNPAGALLDRIETPQRPINCVFGGAEARDLYISTFGGVVVQPMRAYGVAPNPPMSGPAAHPPGRPPTEIPPTLQADLNRVYYREGHRKLLCDLFVPQHDASGMPAIVLVHGGGWLKGDKTKFRPLAIKLAQQGFVTMAIEYRLGYEAHFPAAIHDCNAAVRFLRTNAAHFNVDPDRIYAVGGSAGGHLVGLLATAWDVPELQPTGSIVALASNTPVAESSRPAAAVVMAGPMQIATGSVADRSHRGQESNATHWIGASIDEAPQLYHLADAYEKISSDDPPILFITGSKDNPERDHPSLARLQELGVRTGQIIHDGATHGHWNRAEWMDRVVADIVEFLQQ